VLTSNCTACGACVDACPKHIIEIRKTNKKDIKIYVSCVNKDKGVIARKNCEVACIGCGKCVKVCPHNAITMENSLAYIHADLCKFCRKCVDECPTHAIVETNLPAKKKIQSETQE
jgi:ferredoxin